MASLYVEAKVTWYFQSSPASFSFYADPNCDAFTDGRFTDSITEYAEIEIVGSEALTLARLERDLHERFRDRPAVPEVKEIKQYEYLAGKKSQEECAA